MLVNGIIYLWPLDLLMNIIIIGVIMIMISIIYYN